VAKPDSPIRAQGADFAETGAAISGNVRRLLDVYSAGMPGSAI
jgi:hypothetical protein